MRPSRKPPIAYLTTRRRKPRHTIRARWARGPWDHEPDHVEFVAHGYPCLIRRNYEMGTLNGYMGVPPGHPWFRKHYDKVEASVHGGLTYTSDVVPMGWVYGDISGGYWWLGFDCAHFMDVTPLVLGLGDFAERSMGGVYRDISFVTAELHMLAVQALKSSAESQDSEGGDVKWN